jgi:hypothetical protein
VDVTKSPPPGVPAVRTPTTPPAGPGSPSAGNIAAIADRADIRPLDIPAALQILLAEVRAAFDLQAVLMGGADSATPDTPAQAARALVEMTVQTLPDDVSVPVWTAVLARTESALQLGLERAVDAVSAWRDVSAMVVDAVKETRVLVFSVLSDDPQNPLWLRPEWAGLAPKLDRFWRRRRVARRHLTDPDYSGSFDDDNEHRS